MTMKPQTFKHISRCIDKHGVHHLDALDDLDGTGMLRCNRKKNPGSHTFKNGN
jgi:hypothetical protein